MRLAFIYVLGALVLISCQDADKSYDSIHGPENVLGAPLFSAANRQQDSTNRKLMNLSVKDSLFYAKTRPEEDTYVTPDSAGLIPASPAIPATPIPSSEAAAAVPEAK